MGVIWLPTASAVHTSPQPRTTKDFLSVVGTSLTGSGWRHFDSTDAIRATPERDRPADWVILLDPHAGFSAMTELMNGLSCRVPDLLARPAGDDTWRATVALCSPMFASYPSASPPPTAPDEAEAHRQAEPSFRRNEFYAHVFAGYKWGEIVRADRLSAFLERVIRYRHLLRLSESELLAWKGDGDRLWSALKGEMERQRLHPNFFRPMYRGPGEGESDKAHFLPTLARVYSLGRWNKADVERFVRGKDDDLQPESPRDAPGYSGVWWLHKSPGAFDLQAKLDDLHREAWSGLKERLSGIDRRGLYRLVPSDRALIDKDYGRAAQRNEALARISLYGTLRDMARCLSRGTARWADASREEPGGRPQPIRVLAIKDAATGEFKERMRTVFGTAFRPGHVHLDCLSAEDNAWNRAEWWVRKVERNEKLRVNLEHPAAVDRLPDDRATTRSIRDYDIILLDVQYDTQFLGTQFVQWLDAQFEEAARRAQEACPNERARRPYLFVLSRLVHFGYIHQCMNHGAEAVIAKGRLFSLPQQLTAARVGKTRLLVEPRHSKPNFRTLYSLLPRATNRLRSDQTEDMILGDEYDRPWVAAMPKADLHFHIGTSISHQTIEALAVNTAGYFFQGVAPDPTWQAGRNGANESRRDPGEGDGVRTAKGAVDLIESICRIVVLANVLVNWPDIPKANRLAPPEALWTAARYVLLPRKSPSRVVDPLPPTNDIFDQVIDWLTPKDKPNAKFETCGILVAAVAVFERFISASRNDSDLLRAVQGLAGDGPPPAATIDPVTRETDRCIVPEFQGRWRYLRHQASTYPIQPNDPKSLKYTPLTLCWPLGGELGVMLDYHARRVRANWHDEYTADRVVTPGPDRALQPERIWDDYRVRVEERVKVAVRGLVQSFATLLLDREWYAEAKQQFETSQAEPVLPPEVGEAIAAAFGKGEILTQFVGPGTPKPPPHPLTLKRLVVLPQIHDARVRTLPRYLWGAGLLGAEHLQYPENLLLATWDIVRQNVRDNVVYSEVRCSTNGYCDGGMNVYDATDMLCLGFDLAAAYHGTLSPDERADSPDITHRWVRTNVLLGGKRHKRLSETQDVIALLRSYIRRGVEIPVEVDKRLPRPGVLPGQWWARCRVVGFDLSGDEKNQESAAQKKLEEVIEPLFVDCTPITIHAGEAATADSIWHAVHRYGAQRIGHGLRLRENKRLLTHCVNRGICMELCPISNDFTNIFDDIRPPDGRGRGYVSAPVGRREVYPLRYFLDEGLDACLNTDNRFLHERSTLTDEYLRAAELVSGLTRWEVLKLAKAGFKHAFLSKDERAVMLRHVEFEVFKLTTDEPGELDFPPPGEPTTDRE